MREVSALSLQGSEDAVTPLALNCIKAAVDNFVESLCYHREGRSIVKVVGRAIGAGSNNKVGVFIRYEFLKSL